MPHKFARRLLTRRFCSQQCRDRGRVRDLDVKRAVDREYGNQNKDSRAARSKAWREANPERQQAHSRRHHLWRKFGMTLEDYDQMLASQNGRCAICATTDTAPWSCFTVDHDHKTGAVRALLCQKCNTSIGHAGDDVERLRKAVAYLERFQ
jgi:hypothetical protein